MEELLHYEGREKEPVTNSEKFYVAAEFEIVYDKFFADFGPPNLAQVFKFGVKFDGMIKQANLQNKLLVFYSSLHPHKQVNAVFLLMTYLLDYRTMAPDDIFVIFKNKINFYPYRDASYGVCTYSLSVYDVVMGLYKAKRCQIWNYRTFELGNYEHMNKVENGDMTWILPKRIIAMSGPILNQTGTSKTLSEKEYVSIFNNLKVSCIIRLCKKEYNSKIFTKVIAYYVLKYDLIYEDGSYPTDKELLQFMKICESQKGVVVVHCKAGLGRTGTNIAAYIMKHFSFTAAEAIAWCRICRPGSVLGPQQHYLEYKEAELRNLGIRKILLNQLENMKSKRNQSFTTLFSNNGFHRKSKIQVESIND